jgi:hypothetical protein
MENLEKEIQNLKEIQAQIKQLERLEDESKEMIINNLPFKKGQEINYKGWDCEIRKIMIVGDFEYGKIDIKLDDIFGCEDWVTLQELLDNQNK